MLPAAWTLLRDKREELDRQLSMLTERGTADFRYSSMRLFGTVDDRLAKLAEELLREIPAPSKERKSPREVWVDAEEFRQAAEEEFAYYAAQDESIRSRRIDVRTDLQGLMDTLNRTTDPEERNAGAVAYLRAYARVLGAFFHLRSALADEAQRLQGLFCNTEAQIDRALADIAAGVSPRRAADLANRDAVVCTYVDRIEYLIARPVALGDAGTTRPYEHHVAYLTAKGAVNPKSWIRPWAWTTSDQCVPPIPASVAARRARAGETHVLPAATAIIFTRLVLTGSGVVFRGNRRP